MGLVWPIQYLKMELSKLTIFKNCTNLYKASVVLVSLEIIIKTSDNPGPILHMAIKGIPLLSQNL